MKIRKNLASIIFVGLFATTLIGCSSNAQKEPVYATSVASLNKREAAFYIYDDYTKYFKEDIAKKDISLLKLDTESDTYKSITDFTFSFYDDYTLEIKTTLSTDSYEPDYLIKIDENGTLISKPVYGVYSAKNFYLYHQGTESDAAEGDFLCATTGLPYIPRPTTIRMATSTETVSIEKKTDKELLLEGSEVGKSPSEHYENFADITMTTTYEEATDINGNITLTRLVSRKWKITPYHLGSDGERTYANHYIVYNVKVLATGEREYYWPHSVVMTEDMPYVTATYIPMEVNQEENERWTVEVMIQDSDRANDIKESHFNV